MEKKQAIAIKVSRKIYGGSSAPWPFVGFLLEVREKGIAKTLICPYKDILSRPNFCPHDETVGIIWSYKVY